MIKMKLSLVTVISFLILSIGTVQSETGPEDVEKAYALNQGAMVDMSTARFQSAAQKFIQAASIVPDYQIRGKSLLYTPTFMAAWAFEKIKDFSRSCRYYKQFLEIAPLEFREETKVKHAQEFLSGQCR